MSKSRNAESRKPKIEKSKSRKVERPLADLRSAAKLLNSQFSILNSSVSLLTSHFSLGRRTTRRNGFLLLIALMVLGITMSLLTNLALLSGLRYNEARAAQGRAAAQAVTGSVLAYARNRLPTLATRPAGTEVAIEVGSLLPTWMTGSARLAVIQVDGRKVCHVSSRVDHGSHTFSNELDLPIKEK